MSYVSRAQAHLHTWRWWFWALVPLLAIAAYVTVLRVGFLADDFFQLNIGRLWGLDPFSGFDIDVPAFLRPVGFYFAYQLPWHLWGYNPLPYHVAGLLAHAGSALILGLWLSAATRKPPLGWLAGVLFGVSPLHLEAVAWVGAQFDTFAVLFALASLLVYTLWWLHIGEATGAAKSRRRGWLLYFAAVILYTLGVFTKESLFTFFPIFVLSAWLALPPVSRRGWLKLVYSVLPFLVPIALNLTYRYIKWKSLGGYGNEIAEFGSFAWDNLIAYGRMLLSPLNESVMGRMWVQVVGLLLTVGLLVLLTLYGHQLRRLLFFASVWFAVTVIPVLNLASVGAASQQAFMPNRVLIIPEATSDLLVQNRYLYLASIGFVIAVAGMLHKAISPSGRLRPLRIGLASLLVLASIAICWVQLRPWHTASVQTDELVGSLLDLIPARPRPNGMMWYIDNLPYSYKGVYVLRSGLGISGIFRNGEVDYPNIERVPDARQAPLASKDDHRDAYAIRFNYDAGLDRFVVDYLAGVTSNSDSPPPDSAEVGRDPMIWDFRECNSDIIDSWKPYGTEVECIPGKGLVAGPLGTDSQLVNSSLLVQPRTVGARYVRLRVSATYQPGTQLESYVSDWLWEGPGYSFSQEKTKSMPLKLDGKPHVYWTFLTLADGEQVITGLRWDPVDGKVPFEVHWIAIDLV
ncbi:MAG TPA: hypothetical protein VJ183_10890 [Chloroflexia bacterium]|nr:hypothetical protein [Chloroflexia bacterium]